MQSISPISSFLFDNTGLTDICPSNELIQLSPEGTRTKAYAGRGDAFVSFSELTSYHVNSISNA